MSNNESVIHCLTKYPYPLARIIGNYLNESYINHDNGDGTTTHKTPYSQFIVPTEIIKKLDEAFDIIKTTKNCLIKK